ncbi:MAG: glycosyltransferase family 4 protein [Actinomycetota bacterium]
MGRTYMLTVALDTGPLYGSVTGVGRSVIEVLAEFERRSTEVSVMPYVLSFRAPVAAGTRRLTIPAALALRSWSRWDFPRVDRALAGADLVHGTNFTAPPSRLPRLVTVHDCWALRHPKQCTPAVALSMNVLRRAVETGAHVHAPSRATAEGVREFFPRAPVTVVPWATPRIDVSEPVRPRGASWADGTPIIASVGTIDHRKNPVRLVEAFAAIAGDFPDLLLVLAGAPGTASADVDRAVSLLPADRRSRIVVPGGLTPAEISWLYRASAMVAYPSLDEGFGFPVLEAMAAGVPVVTSASGSLPEVAGDAAMLVDPTDVAALSAALQRVLDDEATRTELIASGRRRVDQFSWSATADGLLDLYRSVAATATKSVR